MDSRVVSVIDWLEQSFDVAGKVSWVCIFLSGLAVYVHFEYLVSCQISWRLFWIEALVKLEAFFNRLDHLPKSLQFDQAFKLCGLILCGPFDLIRFVNQIQYSDIGYDVRDLLFGAVLSALFTRQLLHCIGQHLSWASMILFAPREIFIKRLMDMQFTKGEAAHIASTVSS